MLTDTEVATLREAARRVGIDLAELPTLPLAAGAVPAVDHLGPGRHLVWIDVAHPRW